MDSSSINRITYVVRKTKSKEKRNYFDKGRQSKHITVLSIPFFNSLLIPWNVWHQNLLTNWKRLVANTLSEYLICNKLVRSGGLSIRHWCSLYNAKERSSQKRLSRYNHGSQWNFVANKMIIKSLGDRKAKAAKTSLIKWTHALFNVIAVIPAPSVCQMQAAPWVEIKGTASKTSSKNVVPCIRRSQNVGLENLTRRAVRAKKAPKIVTCEQSGFAH